MSSKFITEIKQDASTEDYYIEIPDHILNTLKWKKGDTICWSIKDGKIILTRLNDTTQSTEEPTMSDYDWYTVKKEEIEEYLNSESEGKEYKDYDEKYNEYIAETAKETFGQAYHSPEAQGNWD